MDGTRKFACEVAMFARPRVGISRHIYYCDKSVNKERRMGERRTGTRDEDEEQGTRPGNEARENLRPRPNSVTGTGNEDPPCVDMGGTSDPISRCIIIGN